MSRKRKRRINPTTTQWAVIGGAGLLTLGLATAAYASSRKKKGLPSVKDGPVDPGNEPTPQEPEPPEDPGVHWVIGTSTDPGYPWEVPILHIDNYPTPGMYFDVGNKTGTFDPAKGFDAMVRAALGSALSMAGNDWTIATAEGQHPNAELGRQLRRQMRELIIAPGGANDLLYGQTNLNFAGGNDPNKSGGNPNKPISGAYVMNSAGRGLNWYPRHANNVERLEAQLSFKRTTRLDGSKLPYPNSGNSQMLVLIPAVNLEDLGPQNEIPIVRATRYADGSSTIHAPPAVRQLGVDLSGVMIPGL